jgi:hypothetical protein
MINRLAGLGLGMYVTVWPIIPIEQPTKCTI